MLLLKLKLRGFHAIFRNVDGRTKVNSNVAFVEQFVTKKWVESIKDAFMETRNIDQVNLIEAGFDIVTEAKKLDDFYKDSLNRK